jgi:hypothetical protein
VVPTFRLLEAATFTVTSATEFAAPNGTPSNRTTIGVCEIVRFMASEPADWQVEGPDDQLDWGSPLVANDQGTFEWRASSLPGSYTITARQHSAYGYGSYETVSIDLQLIRPTAVRLVDNHDVTWYRQNFAGVGFQGQVLLLPLSVSFTGIETHEDFCEPLFTGYFEHPSLHWNHEAGEWEGVGLENKAGMDTVAVKRPGLPPRRGGGAFAAGTHTWEIPWLYRDALDDVEIPLFKVNQILVMVDGTGKMNISKAGWASTRTPTLSP